MKSLFKLLITLLIYSQVQESFAQFKVSGKITDDKLKPTEYVTVLLLKAKDSSMVKASLTQNEGRYQLETNQAGKYVLLVTMVGFEKSYRLLDLNSQGPDKTIDVQLRPSTKLLNEVTVTAQRPFLEQRVDKLVVNVANSPTSAGTTAMEVLQKVPGVLVVEDRIALAGKASVIIMIDGKPSQYSDMTQVLKDLPSASIDKIEVIKNPSAKYDAAGGAVINIVMKRNANLGTNGSIGLTYRGSVFNNSNEGRSANDYFSAISPNLSINHRKGKLNLFASYSYNKRDVFELTRIQRVIGNESFDNSGMYPFSVKVHNYRIGMDVYADKKNTFGFLISGLDRDGDGTNNSITNVGDVTTGLMKSSFQTINYQPIHRTNLAYNINWKHTFDSTGKELNLDLDYANYHLTNSNLITIKDATSSRNNSQQVDNPVAFFTAKVDYTHPFSKDTKLETGGKLSLATIDNDLAFYRSGVLDTQRSNVFNYKENINALYVNLEAKLSEQWEVQAGVRAEQTVATGFSKVDNKNVLDRNYTQLFPSLFLTRKLNKSLALTTSFNRRIDRPSYQQQNPFEFQLDSLTFTRGNPLLRPQLTNEIKLQVTYDGQPFFAVGYNKTDDVIIDNAPQQDAVTKRTFTTAQNLATYKNYFIELNFPIKFGKRVSGFGGNQLIYNAYMADYLGSTFDRGRWNWLAYINTNIKINRTLNAEINGWYMTRSQEQFLLLNPMGALTIGLQQKIMKGQGKLGLTVSDIFYTEQVSGTIQYQDINLIYSQRSASRNARLTFSYSFGNQSLKAARNRKTGAETESNRVKGN